MFAVSVKGSLSLAAPRTNLFGAIFSFTNESLIISPPKAAALVVVSDFDEELTVSQSFIFVSGGGGVNCRGIGVRRSSVGINGHRIIKSVICFI